MTLERITEELRRVAITTCYLFICFSAVLFYRMAVLHSYGIDFEPFGLAAIKALVMGNFNHVGTHDRHWRPLQRQTGDLSSAASVVAVFSPADRSFARRGDDQGLVPWAIAR